MNVYFNNNIILQYKDLLYTVNFLGIFFAFWQIIASLFSVTKQEKADYILKKLKKLYPNPQPPLNHKDNYTLLIAVLLSARCTDERVNKITPLLFAVADNPFSMAQKNPEEIEPIVRPCGMSIRKSTAIVELSKVLVEKYQGDVPNTFEALEALPGVGHKTASVVMVQAFDIPAFPVDTHIHRLAKRWGLTRGKNEKETETDLKALFPSQSWHDVHLQIIFYGREYCTARGCDGTRCEICRFVNQK